MCEVVKATLSGDYPLPSSKTLMIGLGSGMYRDAQGRLFVEDQTASGLHAWQVYFDKIIAVAICDDAPAPAGWSLACDLGLEGGTIELVALPDTYAPRTMWQTWPVARRLLSEAMDRADYLTFAYGGWIGDPGEMAAQLAASKGRKHAIWLDRVESQVFRSTTPGIKGRIKAAISLRREKRALARADLAMLHGRTVFDTFKNIARNPHIVEDIHLEDSDRIPVGLLAQKLKSATAGPLRFAYVGRADDMKGWQPWLQVLAELNVRDVPFEATWLGAGPALEAMTAKAEALGITSAQLTLPGFVSDRAKVLDVFRSAQFLLFCHMTDESPRNLIESLHSATPLVGFSDGFSAGLVQEQGAGHLVNRGDVAALTDVVTSLHADRNKLNGLIIAASHSARHLTRQQVFQERAEIMMIELDPLKSI
jgi:colanic acid/amylovoran biosynthesis glycosyltransferase